MGLYRPNNQTPETAFEISRRREVRKLSTGEEMEKNDPSVTSRFYRHQQPCTIYNGGTVLHVPI